MGVFYNSLVAPMFVDLFSLFSPISNAKKCFISIKLYGAISVTVFTLIVSHTRFEMFGKCQR